MAGLADGRTAVSDLKKILSTLLIAAVGGSLVQALGMPAGLLSGAMLTVAIAALMGVDVYIPDALRNGIFIILGLLLGSAVTPETLQSIPRWPFTLIGIGLCAGVMMAVLPFYLVRYGGLDRMTARLGCVSGCLQLCACACYRTQRGCQTGCRHADVASGDVDVIHPAGRAVRGTAFFAGAACQPSL